MKKSKPLYSIPWDKAATSTKMVRRAFLMAEESLGIPTKANWLLKWGNSYDIAYNDRQLIPTGCEVLYLLTYREWVMLANKLNPI